MKIRNIFGTRFRGTLGKEIVASSWKGREYIKEYQAPTNARTPLQLQHRALFAQAVQAWKGMSAVQRAFYGKIANGVTGFNLFLGRYIHAVRNGQEPETPAVLRWTTADGQPVPGAWLVVRKAGKVVWIDGLEDGAAEIAVTAEDAPYDLVLRKGTVEEVALVLEEGSETEVPETLTSEHLGITLVFESDVGPTPAASETAEA